MSELNPWIECDRVIYLNSDSIKEVVAQQNQSAQVIVSMLFKPKYKKYLQLQGISMSTTWHPNNVLWVWVVGVTNSSLLWWEAIPLAIGLGPLKMCSFDTVKRLFTECTYSHVTLPQYLLLKFVCPLVSEEECSKTSFLQVILLCRITSTVILPSVIRVKPCSS